MRHLQKHHRISLGLVHEMVQSPQISLEHIATEKQKGDLMTKGLARPKHEPACRMVGIYPCLFQVITPAAVAMSLVSCVGPPGRRRPGVGFG